MQVTKSVLIDEEDIKWFDETYPGGTYSWIFNMLMKEFRQAHSITPQDYAAIGARELKKKLEDGSTR